MDGDGTEGDVNLHVSDSDNWINYSSLYGLGNKRRGDWG